MKRAKHQPTTALCLYAGLYCKTWTVADAGTLLPQHAHEHDHITLVVRGAVRVWRGERMDGDYQAPQMVKIPARQFHKFLTLCDDVVLACIHAVGADGEPAIHEDHVIEMED
jgi:quercetin dioxygenase-like cupin family protein